MVRLVLITAEEKYVGMVRTMECCSLVGKNRISINLYLIKNKLIMQGLARYICFSQHIFIFIKLNKKWLLASFLFFLPLSSQQFHFLQLLKLK
jgi:hypothetical protein